MNESYLPDVIEYDLFNDTKFATNGGLFDHVMGVTR